MAAGGHDPHAPDPRIPTKEEALDNAARVLADILIRNGLVEPGQRDPKPRRRRKP